MKFVHIALLLRSFAFASSVALALSPQLASAAPGEVVVMAWGTTWDEGLNTVADAFEKETGLKVVRVNQSGSSDGLARLQSMRDKPEIDVWFSTTTYAAQAAKDGQLLATFSPSDLTNSKDLIPGAISKSWVAAYYYSLSIVYRPDIVKQPIKSWNDLWSENLKGLLAVPDVQTYAGRMLLVANELAGGNIDDVTPGMEKLKAMKPNISLFYRSDSDSRRALAQGEIGVLVGPPSQAKPLRDGGVDVAVVSPKPSPVMFDVMSLVNTPQKTDALKFMDFVVSKSSQEIISHDMSMAPVNKLATPSKELADILPKIDDQVVFDDAIITEKIGGWNERFLAEVAQ